MMRRFVFGLFLSAVLLGLAGPVGAQVPSLIHYQGSLTEGDFPVDDVLDMRFALYPQATGGSPVWSESRSDVSVQNGRFSVLLGAETAFPEGLFAEQDALYLQVEVGDQALPRLQLVSTAYALRADVADGVAAGAIDAEALADGAVEAVAIAPGAVTSAAVANDALTDEDIAAGAITTGELADGAVTNAKLAETSISSSKLRVGSVAQANIVDGAVGSEQIADGAVSSSKIATSAAVRTLNDLTDQVSIEGGDDISVSTDETNNTITISSSGGLTGQPSSQRWKTDIRSLDDALSLVERLRGVRFVWEDSGQEDVGLIAEEVGQVVPEVVTYEENGTDARTVNYSRLVALLVEALKQQQQQLDQRTERVNALAERVDRLEQLVRDAASDKAAASSPDSR